MFCEHLLRAQWFGGRELCPQEAATRPGGQTDTGGLHGRLLGPWPVPSSCSPSRAPEAASAPLLRKAAGCALLSQNPPDRGLAVPCDAGARPSGELPRLPGSSFALPSEQTLLGFGDHPGGEGKPLLVSGCHSALGWWPGLQRKTPAVRFQIRNTRKNCLCLWFSLPGVGHSISVSVNEDAGQREEGVGRIQALGDGAQEGGQCQEATCR